MIRSTSTFAPSLSRISAACCLWAVLLPLSGCGSAAPEAEPVVSVRVTPVKRGPIALTVSAEAILFPLHQAIIAPKISSTIKKFYVQRGTHVKQGQLLAELENADLVGTAEQSRGEFEQAEAGYATTTGASLPEQIQKAELDAAAFKSAYDAQSKIYEARKNLFDQGAIPRRDLDSAEVALAQARSQNEQAQKQLTDLEHVGKAQTVKSAGGQLSAAKGKYLNAKAQLSYSEIRSPIGGVITDRPLFDGELAAANQPILTVMDVSKLTAKAHVSQAEALQLKVGDPAEVKLDGLADTVPGKVSLISPALDPGSTTIEVWVESDKPNSALRPGMNVQVEVAAKKKNDALFIPSSALFQSPETGDFVLLAGSDKKAHQVKVKTGLRNKEFSEILSGLKENDSVITQGGYALPDGTAITVEASAPADQTEDENKKGDSEVPAGNADAAPKKAAPPAGKE